MAGSFLDMQSRVGITAHIGGLAMTRTLLSLCHVEDADEILDVGCGIGVGPAFAARTYACRVVGVDLSDRMIEWSRQRAREERVENRVELRVADVLALPFEDGRFDATVCESVLAFVTDKERAIAEMVRVTKPGGRVGLEEMFLRDATPSPRVEALARLQATDIVSLDALRMLWDRSGLEGRVIRTCRINLAREVRSRLRWIGPRWLLKGCARLARLYATDPALRPALRLMVGTAPRAPEDEPGAPPPWSSFGYGLFVGRKPLGPEGASPG